MKTSFAAAMCAALLFLHAATASAASFAFNVTIDTSALVATASSPDPFALYFQLTGGDPLANTVTISDFDFYGGTPSSNPAATPSGPTVSGDLSSSVVLTANSGAFLNEFWQGFVPGSAVSFLVSLTTNVNAPAPDLFKIAILDGNLFEIPTTGLADALLLVNIDAVNLGMSAVQTYRGAGDFSGVSVSASAVPEPATLLLLGSGLALAARRRRA